MGVRRLARAGLPGARAGPATRQELYFLAGGPAWGVPGVPAYVDYDRAFYGTGDLDGLGVKAAVDHDGPPLDPDAAPAGERRAARPTPGRSSPSASRPWRSAPLAGAKTCRYELSPDGHFIAARHPQHPSVWLLGGGSGHGFKHGPALAERMAVTLDGTAALPAHFGLHDRGPGALLRTAGAATRE